LALLPKTFLTNFYSNSLHFSLRPNDGQTLSLERGADSINVARPIKVQVLGTSAAWTSAAATVAKSSARLTIVEDDLFGLALLAEL